MAQREVHRNAEDSDATTTGRKTPWTRKRAARRNAELASMAKLRKRLPSMQTTATGDMRAAAHHAGTPQQPGASQLPAASLHQPGAANPHQPGAVNPHLSAAGSPHLPGATSSHQPGATSSHQPGATSSHQPSAASSHQPSAASLHQPGAASSQQPGPSLLTATEPDTPFPVWSESDDDDDLHAIDAEDEMPIAPGLISGLSSFSSDDAEVNIAL